MMRRTIEGWLVDADEAFVEQFPEEVEFIAQQAVQAVREVLVVHHRVNSSEGAFCSSCPDLWPCDTIRRVAKALEVRA